MKYTIKKHKKEWQRNYAREVAALVGCTKSNIDHHFSFMKKEHAIVNGYLIIKN